MGSQVPSSSLTWKAQLCSSNTALFETNSVLKGIISGPNFNLLYAIYVVVGEVTCLFVYMGGTSHPVVTAGIRSTEEVSVSIKPSCPLVCWSPWTHFAFTVIWIYGWVFRSHQGDFETDCF